jgi:FAD-dependent urate hydroxylase
LIAKRRPSGAALRADPVGVNQPRDRFKPDGRDGFDQAEEPFLGLEVIERARAPAPWAPRVHCFTFAAYLSHGAITGDIPFISIGAERVANGVAALLFAED